MFDKQNFFIREMEKIREKISTPFVIREIVRKWGFTARILTIHQKSHGNAGKDVLRTHDGKEGKKQKRAKGENGENAVSV